MGDLFKPQWLNRDDFRKAYPEYEDKDWRDIDQRLRRAELIIESLVSTPSFTKTDRVLLAGYIVTSRIYYFENPENQAELNSGYTRVRMPDVEWQREDSYYKSNPLVTPEVLDLLSEYVELEPFYTIPEVVPGDAGYRGGENNLDYTVPDYATRY